MSNSITVWCQNISMRKSNIPKFLNYLYDNVDAAKAYLSNEWVERDKSDDLAVWLKDTMHQFGFDITLNPRGGVKRFDYWGESLHDEEREVFNAMGPFVKAGSFISFHDDECGPWRLYFDGTECHEEDAHAVLWKTFDKKLPAMGDISLSTMTGQLDAVTKLNKLTGHILGTQ